MDRDYDLKKLKRKLDKASGVKEENRGNHHDLPENKNTEHRKRNVRVVVTVEKQEHIPQAEPVQYTENSV